MSSVQNTINYCSISKDGQILFVHKDADNEIENLAALCLEMTPSYHRWYFQTMDKKTFGFLIDDGYVYFSIVNESLGKPHVLQFLEKLRDEFRTVTRKGATKGASNVNFIYLQDQLVPIIHHFISSVDQVSGATSNWITGSTRQDEQLSRKAPLLAKPSKKENKKKKEHVIAVRDIELEELSRSTDRGVTVDLGAIDSRNQDAAGSPDLIKRDFGLTRTKSSSRDIHKKWCRQVRIVIAIDIVVCIVLLVIWLAICRGIKCIS